MSDCRSLLEKWLKNSQNVWQLILKLTLPGPNINLLAAACSISIINQLVGYHWFPRDPDHFLLCQHVLAIERKWDASVYRVSIWNLYSQPPDPTTCEVLRRYNNIVPLNLCLWEESGTSGISGTPTRGPLTVNTGHSEPFNKCHMLSSFWWGKSLSYICYPSVSVMIIG